MGDFQEDNFEQKLLAVKDTQESIQSLSLWCLKHSQQHKKIVSCWLHVLKKVKVEQRLTLFYLANDVIQYSKRKNYPFVDSWATALQKATPLVREEKVRHKILRLFKIWNERNIYDETFLADLSGLLTALTKKTSNQQTAAELIQEFQPSSLFLKIRKCKALEEDTDLKLKIVKECSIPVSDPDALQVVVKDRRNGDDLMQDVEDGIVKLEAYTEALESEIKERVDVINVLEVSEQFYDTQRGEAKVVCNAYRNFGNRIKTLKRKLEELLPSLPSPVPSPDIDAPSPSSESDIDIPEETKAVCYDSEKSFIGTDFVTAMNHVSENQNQLRRSVSQNYGHSDMNSSVYNPNMTNNYDEYAHQRHMNAAPIGYYKNNSHLELESPASPIERNITHDSFLHFTEGNPIEVISSTNNDNHSNFNASGFLQNIMAANASAMSTPAPIPPVPGKIPGLESPTDNARDVFCFMEAKAKTADESGPIMWGDKPLTKYQSWPSPDITWTNSQETPVSPPAFEKESFSTPVEYVDTNHPVMDSRGQFLFNSEQPPPPQPQHQHEEHQQKQRLLDMDHRLINHLAPSERSDQISTIPLPKLDTDDRIQPMCSVPNRNLISLTDSPSSSGNESWKASNDADYRGDIPVPPPTPTKINNLKMPQDNIESVDMELSDDESESKGEERNNINSNAATRHRKSSFREEESSSSSTLSKIPTNIDGDKDRGIDEDAQLLLPPPNPWDMMNVPHLDSGAINESLTNVSKMAEVDFNKMMSNFVNQPPSLEPPIAGGGRPPPLPDFTQFPLPPLPTGQPPPPPPFGSDIRFPQPPVMSIPPPPPPSTADSSAFHTRPDYGRLPPANHLQRPPNFRPLPPQPFGFMPSPMFMNNGSMGQSMATSTPTKEFPPVHQQQKMYGRHSESPGSASSDTNEQRYGNNIEPLIKTRQFDRQTPDSGVSGAGSGMGSRFDMGHEISSNKSMRSNLKEISLSDVLERSILRSKDEEEIIPNSQSQVDAASGACAIDHDLFSSVDDAMDENNGGSGSAVKDDGADDLYNNIDETHADVSGQNSVTTNSTAAVPQITSTEALAAAVVAAVSNSMAVAAAAAAAFSAGNKTPVPKTLPSDFKFAQNNNFGLYDSVEAVEPNSGSGETSEFQSPVKPKTPFQAIVPKVAKPLVAPPPNFMEDDERSPWPLMPVIDLSGEANDISTDEGGDGGDSVTGGGGYNQQYQHPNNSYNMDRANGSPAAFLRPHMKNDFRPRFFGSGGGDRRFSSPGQSPMRGTGGDVRGRGRFSSQRGDFRPRGGGGGYQMSPNQIRMPRTPSPFQRSPGGVNFQNSPRMFKGSRPNRPFRRNW